MSELTEPLSLEEFNRQITRLHQDTMLRMGMNAYMSDDYKEQKAFLEVSRDGVPGLKVEKTVDPYANLPTINVQIIHGHVQAQMVAPAKPDQDVPLLEDVTPKAKPAPFNLTLDELAPEPELPELPKLAALSADDLQALLDED